MILNIQKSNLEGENFNMYMTEDHCKDKVFLQGNNFRNSECKNVSMKYYQINNPVLEMSPYCKYFGNL